MIPGTSTPQPQRSTPASNASESLAGFFSNVLTVFYWVGKLFLPTPSNNWRSRTSRSNFWYGCREEIQSDAVSRSSLYGRSNLHPVPLADPRVLLVLLCWCKLRSSADGGSSPDELPHSRNRRMVIPRSHGVGFCGQLPGMVVRRIMHA